MRIAIAMLLLAAAACGHDDAGTGRAQPVSIALVKLQHVPHGLTAIGHVEAIASVTIRSRVDGQIERVGFRDGADVKAGQLLFQIDARPYRAALRSAQATLQKDRATLDRNRAQLRRYDELSGRSYVSKDEMDAVRAGVDSLAGAVAADEAAVESAALALGYTMLRAPISGRAGKALVKAGNMVRAADATNLATINQLNPVYVDFSVPEPELPLMRRALDGGSAVVHLESDGDAALGGMTGKLIFLDNGVDPATGTVQARAEFDNRDTRLWPGQFVHLKLDIGGATLVLAAPATAVRDGPNGSFAFIIDATNHAVQRTIEVARVDGDFAVIRSGLAAGERVVTDGQLGLRPGAAVTVAVQAASAAR